MAFDPKNFPTNKEIYRATRETDWYKLYKAEPLSFIDYSNLAPNVRTDLNDRMVQRLKEYFENDVNKAQLLDRAINASRKIVDAGTTYMFRRGFSVKVGEEGQNNEELQKQVDQIIERNKLTVTLPESSKLYQAVGHSHFKVWKKNGKAKVTEIPFDYWFPNWDGVMLGEDPQNIRIAVTMDQTDNLGKVQQYIYLEDYEVLQNVLQIKKQLWTSSMNRLSTQVDLQIAGIKDAEGNVLSGSEVMEPVNELDVQPFVTINRSKTIKDRFAQSILEPVYSQLVEVNDRLTGISIEFLKHLHAKLEMPENAITRDSNGKVKMKDVEVIFTKPGDNQSRYVSNENPLIEVAFEHIDRCLKHAAKFTQTPEDFLVGSDRAAERVEAMRIRMDDFLARIEQDQAIYASGIKDLIRLCLKVEGVKKPEEIPMEVEFSDPMPRDRQADVQVWSDAYASGLASKETAVANFQNIDGVQLEDELAKIAEEENAKMMSAMAQAAASMPGNDPNADPASDPNQPAV